MAYTNFCCLSGGSNLNAGTRTGDSTVPGTAADFTYASGNWVQSTGVFTVASGNPSGDGVAVGDFASVYPDGSSTAVFIGRITARDTTTITVSLTAKSGTAPTDGTGNRTLKVGGAWAGPAGASGFPLSFMTSSCTNSTGNRVRINMKNDATYDITAAITLNNDLTIQGFTTSYGDLGRAEIDGGTSGSSYVPLTATNGAWFDLIFDHNGSTGGANGPGMGNTSSMVGRCVFSNMKGHGYSGTVGIVFLCESYGNGGAGFSTFGSGNLINCIAHDNTSDGFSGIGQAYNCIADTNGGIGFNVGNNWPSINIIYQCDAYNNTGDGLDQSGTGQLFVMNCNFIKNGGYGIDPAGHLHTRNCAFGAGTQANTSGTIDTTTGANIDFADEQGSVNYASNVTPWNDPANGDFKITLAAAINAGYGTFTQTAASYAGAIGYPDIGAVQHQESGGGGGGGPLIDGRLVR